MARKNKRKPTYKRRSFRRKPFKLNLKKGTIQSIFALTSVALAGLTAVSFTGETVLLHKINRVMLDYFGWTSVFIPFLIFVIGLVLANYSLPFTKPNVLVGTLLAVLSLAGLTGAGTIGVEIWTSLVTVITAIGASLLLLSSLLVGVMVLFNLSLDQFVVSIAKLLMQIKKTLIVLTGVSLTKTGQLGQGREITIKGQAVEDKGLTVNNAATNDDVRNDPAKNESKTTVQMELMEMRPASNPQPGHQIWELPPLSLLDSHVSGKADRGDVKKNAAVIEKTLDSFNIRAQVVEVNLGPAVTQYALEVSMGTKLSKITGLGSDLAMALAARTGQIRVEAPIPGRSLVGIELPNISPEFVGLKKILQSDLMKKSKSKLELPLGLDVAGQPVSVALSKMPHLLIAGSTGSGKSVCINSFVSSVLFNAAPTEVKFIMVDPKRVELTRYNSIPHLLTPVIVEPKKVLSALKWLTDEMDRRYKLFAEVGSRNLINYNELSGFQALPYIVVVVDELADVMMFAPSEVEDLICRLAQMARATGIHLVIATQRPSVDVLTGLIKANIPARIAFAVSSMTDSRVVLDTPGAEKLLGQGDMLFLPPDQAKPTRIQGAFISDTEVGRLLDFIKAQGVPVEYTEEVLTTPTGKITSGIGKTADSSGGEGKDDLFDQAIRLITSDKASASLLQRKLSIGYARAARILDQMEQGGLVGPADGSKPREVFMGKISEYLAQRTS